MKIQKDFDAHIIKDYSFSCLKNTKGEDKKIVNGDALGQIFNKYFAYALTDRDNVAVGTAVSLDFGNNDTKLNLNISNSVGKSSYLTFGVSLPVKDKSGALFSNNRISSGVNGTIKFSKRLSSRIYYSRSNCPLFDKGLREEITLQKMLLNGFYYRALSLYQDLKLVDKEITDCNGPASIVSVSSKPAAISSCDSLIQARVKIMSELNGLIDEENQKTKLQSAKDSLINYQVSKAPLNVVQFWWYSISGSYNNETNLLFDKTRIKPEAAIFEKSHNRFKVGLELNRFFDFQPSYKGAYPFGWTGYFSFGFFWEADNNIKQLSASRSPLALITANNDTINTTSEADKKIIFDATTKSYRNIGTIASNVRYLAYYHSNRKIGIDIFGNALFNRLVNGPVMSVGAGIVYNVKNQDAAKPKVSFELFYRLNDISKRLPESRGVVFERNEIGITTVIPFQRLIL